MEAIRKKYASDCTSTNEGGTIHISGKEVKEVGFEKIRQQLADFQALRIVLVDQLCVASNAAVADLCPDIQELDLSRNLFETIETVLEIAGQLDQLESLRIDGNRFERIKDHRPLPSLLGVASLSFLSLDDTLLKWYEVCLLNQHISEMCRIIHD